MVSHKPWYLKLYGVPEQFDSIAMKLKVSLLGSYIMAKALHKLYP